MKNMSEPQEQKSKITQLPPRDMGIIGKILEAHGNKTVDGETIPFKINPVPTSSRIVIVETVSFQSPHMPLNIVEVRASRPVVTDEQVYSRNLPLDQEWRPIELGWFADCPEKVGMVVVKNFGPARRMQGNPDQTEQDELANSVVEVSCHAVTSVAFVSNELIRVADMYVPPRESLRVQPVDARVWRIRCRGKTRVQINVYPV